MRPLPQGKGGTAQDYVFGMCLQGQRTEQEEQTERFGETQET